MTVSPLNGLFVNCRASLANFAKSVHFRHLSCLQTPNFLLLACTAIGQTPMQHLDALRRSVSPQLILLATYNQDARVAGSIKSRYIKSHIGLLISCESLPKHAA